MVIKKVPYFGGNGSCDTDYRAEVLKPSLNKSDSANEENTS
jgi:hypothetical protein